jgi:hypothetical protein
MIAVELSQDSCFNIKTRCVGNPPQPSPHGGEGEREQIFMVFVT